uniref:Tubulin delta chain n=1 Tax=Polytomella parva TaxID=51329 RepID=A0A7S0YA75_9CHLO|mmetsp:Transcript_12807/g.22785  ORF Transcript_12807/g.22785 Transcript_12807/m.22785 type:complete len:566 (+) Transcript_12807:50-1747(+)|eukprot:CAMPEP_0175067960 /NCGR_PEP_ID=MMETSP0052_2-20121109/17403_1 /TAXON_ID=51329 ORGANISM="Polytomella parva, Strain SAG 63-3" /NCGR_SAMPLE_ID=MMETSP0052_2 /ASSEMBLY_ACC=CAM_ASM_000194 /LENGTH=565 /DNA_ID=CAMNT_0016334929 /DNA_START=122 /DNA_END=1819 /DNA_ORIENTATION=+
MPLVTIQLGQCGNQLGSSFFHTLGEELSSNDYGTQVVSEFFRPNPAVTSSADVSSRNRPLLARALLVDMEPKVVDAAYSSTSLPSCSPEPSHPAWWWSYARANRLCQQGGSGNNWSLGFHGFGPSMETPLLDLVRKEVEHCDSLSGFLLIQSAAGGTGAGFGTFAAQAIRDTFPEAHMLSCCVWPYDTGEVVVQPYNTLLTMAGLTTATDGVILLENEGLHRMCQKVYDVASPSFSNLNLAAARSLAALLLPSRTREVCGCGGGRGSGEREGRGSGRDVAGGEASVNKVSRRLIDLHLHRHSPSYTSSPFSPSSDGPSSSSYGTAPPLTNLGDMVEHLCAHPAMRLLTMRTAPQVAPQNVQYTSFAWPAILKRMRQMALTGSVVESGMDWTAETDSRNCRLSYNPLQRSTAMPPYTEFCRHPSSPPPPPLPPPPPPPPPPRNVSLADWLVLRGSDAERVDVSDLADPKLHDRFVVDPLKVSYSGLPYGGCTMHTAMISNDQGCVRPMERMQGMARAMLASHAFVHQYERYGMDDQELRESFDSVEETLERYRLLSPGGGSGRGTY